MSYKSIRLNFYYSKLKNSQQLEQNAYSHLENALKASNEACEERKKKQVMVRKPRPVELTKMRGSQTAQEYQSVNGIQE